MPRRAAHWRHLTQVGARPLPSNLFARMSRVDHLNQSAAPLIHLRPQPVGPLDSYVSLARTCTRAHFERPIKFCRRQPIHQVVRRSSSVGVDERQRYLLADFESVSAMSLSARARTHSLTTGACIKWISSGRSCATQVQRLSRWSAAHLIIINLNERSAPASGRSDKRDEITQCDRSLSVGACVSRRSYGLSRARTSYIAI